ncbi:hypothetical protein PG993_012358 [Apiospora rasikravindrae]|uniref:MICOS complex subunit MIC12 n=1 Tax=Apiospora rasikravindrae TaxID=990691 RepID=A0ABR1S3K1_9PEZI
MGFTTGFTGGVTLTLGVAYLTVLAHQRNRERQSAVLRAQTDLISGLTDPLPPVHPPTRAELAALERQNLLDTAKDRWNTEIEGAVRWAQHKDWTAVREEAESVAGNLWTRAFSEAGQAAEEGKKTVVPKARDAREEARKEAAWARDAANEKAAKSAYADAKARGADAVNKGEQKAEEAKGSIFSALGSGLQKGKEAIGFAKTKAGEAGQQLEHKADEQFSPVEQALRQRYEGPSWTDKSVEEVLADRYTPVDKRDQTLLRGV